MIEQERWESLISRLLRVCVRIGDEMSAGSNMEASSRIFRALFQKGVDTLHGIQVLYKKSLPIQAQVLVRVIVEVRMDFEIFVRLAAENRENAVRRVGDAMMLEKIKQQRESDFRGLDLIDGAPTREELLQRERSLVEKYGRDVAGRMRRNGFSGMSVEERARETGLSNLYHVVYRNFSRNVHSTDYMESISVQGMGGWSRWPEYKDLRDHVAMSAAITCVWQMSLMANEAVGCGLREELKEIWEMCLGFEHWVGFPTGKEE